MNIHQLALGSAFIEPDDIGAPTTAWLGHIPFGSWLIQALQPGIFVELGTHFADSYFAFCKSVQTNGLNTQCYAVDTWQGDEHAGEYSDEVYNRVRGHNDTHYSAFSRLLRMTFDQALDQFSDGSVDLLHIDGLHTYEAVRHDFETWLPRLSERAVVLFHDTNVREGDFGVWRYWEELTAQYPSISFDHSNGLGVLFVGKSQPPVVQALLEEWATPDGRNAVRRLFDRLGQAIFDAWRFRAQTRELGGRCDEIFALEQKVFERDAHLDELRAVIREQQGVIEEREATIDERQEMIDELNGQVATLQGQLADQRHELALVLGSQSWRITQPLRALSARARQGMHTAQRLRGAVQDHGGLVTACRKAVHVYRLRGLHGLKQGFKAAAGPSTDASPAVNSGSFDRNDYSEWVRRYDTLTDENRQQIAATIAGLPQRPRFSVLVYVRDTPLEQLDAIIDAVRGQLYPHWQLCIADASPEQGETSGRLAEHAQIDARINVLRGREGDDPAMLLNQALQDAEGEWIALLDPACALSPHALYWFARKANDQPGLQLIYADDDLIDATGLRRCPNFKSEWNPELFYARGLFQNLGVYRNALVDQLNGFRPERGAALQLDLALRCIEQIDGRHIGHVPRVLCHRQTGTDNNTAPPASVYVSTDGEAVLNEHFRRTGTQAVAQVQDAGYRIQYALPDDPPMVSIIIPTRNGLHLLRQCLESVFQKTTYPNYEIVIMDNGSDDPATLDYFKELAGDARVTIIRDDSPFNYSALNNKAVRQASGSVIVLMNNDIEVISPDWLSEMVSISLQPEVGAVGARLWYPDDTLQHAGVILGIRSVAGHVHKQLPRGDHGYAGRAAVMQSLSAVTAACLAIRKSVYEQVGGLNETDLTVAFNDVDFCLRVRDAGYRNVWTPHAELYHHESASRGMEDSPEKMARFAKEVHYMRVKWDDALLNDPAYNPNLTLDDEDFSLAWPPRISPV